MKEVPFLLTLLLMTASLAGCLGDDADDDSDDTPDAAPAVTWLAIQTATNATSNNGTLILETQDDVFVFSDRPYRLWKNNNQSFFSILWSLNGTFHEDPPNAILTWESDNDSMAFAEVILTNATWNNDTGFIEYSYTFETGDTLPSNMPSVSLFIDGWFGCGGPGALACAFDLRGNDGCDLGKYKHWVDDGTTDGFYIDKELHKYDNGRCGT